jgi:hypothetical protein
LSGYCRGTTTNGVSPTAWSRSPRISARCTELRVSPPIIVVYSLTHAVAALKAAVNAEQAIILLSAADAGIYAGAGWFKALADTARDAVPTANFSAALDCGDDAGAAMAVLRAGIDTVIFTGSGDVAERLAGIAEQRGARLLTQRPQPALDLEPLFFADAETLRQRCAEILG